MRGLSGIVGGLVGASVATAAMANDSTAELTTGGLVFRTTPNIEMRSEDLYISREKVTVRYRFFNKAAADETVTVAFPMPDINAAPDTNISIPDLQSDNFLDFATKVDGKPVTARIEQKAIVGTKDVTERLRRLKVPLMPTSTANQTALDALPEATQKSLLDAGIVRPDDYDVGKGMEHHIAPEWSLKTTYFWQQTFPSNKEIVVEHTYKPSVGSSVETLVQDAPDPETKRKYTQLYCPDAAFLAGIKARTKAAKGQVPPEYRLAYILKTGANWAGPIGDFRLTVDKGTPGALVSFCETGVKKTGPTTFEVRKQNFTPKTDLNILIIDGLGGG